MTPTATVRAAVYRRDGDRCVACHTASGLTFQHRAATGMGGTKIRPSVVAGLTLCAVCNQAAEASMQLLALESGWKIRRHLSPELVPVRYPHEFGWFLLQGVTRRRITGAVALDLMQAAYGDQYFTFGLT